MTTTPAAAGKAAAGAGEEGVKRRSKGAIAFVSGFVLAGTLTAIATLSAVSEGGRIQPHSLWMLIGSLVISGGLAAILVHRIVRILRGHYRDIPGGQLHIRFLRT